MIGVSVPGVAFGRAVILFFLFLPIAFAITYINWRRLSRTTLQYSSFPSETRQLALTCMLIGLAWLVSCALSIDPMKSFSICTHYGAGRHVLFIDDVSRTDTQIFDTACKALIVANSAILLAAIIALYVDESLFDLYRSVKGYDASTIQTLKPYFSVAVCILPLVLWYGSRERGVWGILAVLHIPFTLLLIYGRGEQPGLSASIGLGSAVIALIGVWALTCPAAYRLDIGDVRNTRNNDIHQLYRLSSSGAAHFRKQLHQPSGFPIGIDRSYGASQSTLSRARRFLEWVQTQ